MADKKSAGIGKGTPGPGRGKGTPNRTTRDVREAIAKLVQANMARLQEWLDAVARDDPGRALDIFARLLEYHIPKLGRQEMQHTVAIDEQKRIEEALIAGRLRVAAHAKNVSA